MKQLKTLGLVVFAAAAFTACNNTEFKTTASGLKYKIYEGGSKDSVKIGEVLKFNVTQKVSGTKDTTLYNSYETMPEYMPLQTVPPGQGDYSPIEILPKLKKGDSAVIIMFVDSLIKKGLAQEAQLPPFMKKGDKFIFTFKVLEVFKNDSLAMLDRQKEMEAYQKREEAKQKADSIAFEKSGGKQKQIAAVEEYLKKKNITATKTALGTFVKIDAPGDGAPIANGKFVTVKYNGKHLLTDSTFQSSSFTVPIGQQGSIPGFEDGLKQFKKGGKGVIYIPGFLAYGKTPPPGSPFKEYEPLYFEVEITDVSDNMPQPQAPPVMPQEQPQKDTKK
ncbi:FKBP-type peptidyl-prolyl cis-trans isomerase [Niabella beijingensis]|uniref:FKBP-type peptidyl-prolyl cis-trans isomerase n=1 Tax=Niabella beijingensis TaxID=2872700 RepID=UPI001CC00FF3|nr:FKBP-type peptidyl-prolyl cis-trans isomerase [Niabella beijingensis]MBZ4191245.1 FKBP-type peptidyl-prolyl cis-trans isomerase [Niabella beijingensis]